MKKLLFLLLLPLLAATCLKAQEYPPSNRTQSNLVLADRATLSHFFMGIPHGTTPMVPAYVADTVKCGAIYYKVTAGDTVLCSYNCLSGKFDEYVSKNYFNALFGVKGILNQNLVVQPGGFDIGGTGTANAFVAKGATFQALSLNGTANWGYGNNGALSQTTDIGATANGQNMFGAMFNSTFSTGNTAATLTIISGGGGYTDGSYFVYLKNTSNTTGISPSVNITVSGGIVTSATISPGNGGARNLVNNVLQLLNSGDLGPGSGFSCKVATTTGYTGVTYHAFGVENADIQLAPSTANYGSANIPDGVTPSAPPEGEVWNDGTNAWMKVGGVPTQLTNQLAGGMPYSLNLVSNGSGAAPGNYYNGASSITLSYNSIGAAASLKPTATQTTSYTANYNDLVLTDASSATVPVLLPNAPPDKSLVGVKMMSVSGSFTTTVTTQGSDVINQSGTVTYTIKLSKQTVYFQYQLSTGIWLVINDDLPLSQLDARYASGTRNLTAGFGLVGGGDLSADRSFKVDSTLFTTKALISTYQTKAQNIAAYAPVSASANYVQSQTATPQANGYSVSDNGILTRLTGTLPIVNEYYNVGYGVSSYVGNIGNPELNVSYNMDYATIPGVHQYSKNKATGLPASTYPAIWTASGINGFYIQYALAGQTQTGFGAMDPSGFVAGSSYTPTTVANYPLVAITGIGTGATANITTDATGKVSLVLLGTGGQNFAVGDLVGCPTLPGGGSGFQIKVLKTYNDIWLESGQPYMLALNLLSQAGFGFTSGNTFGNSQVVSKRGSGMASYSGYTDIDIEAHRQGPGFVGAVGNFWINQYAAAPFFLNVGGGPAYLEEPNTTIGSSATTNSVLYVNGSVSSVSGIGRGIYNQNTVTATANNDILYGESNVTTFNDAGFTGVQHIESQFFNPILFTSITTPPALPNGAVWYASPHLYARLNSANVPLDAPAATSITGILLGTQGGTGINNGAKTITIGGNFATSGAFASTLTLTANTNVTLPTTGTLASLAGTETFTNHTFGSSTDILGGVTMGLGSDAVGDIYYGGTSHILNRLPIGATGQIFTVSGGLPSWAPSYVPVSTLLTGQTGATTVKSITTDASGTLHVYQISGTVNISSATTDVLEFEVTYFDDSSVAQTVILYPPASTMSPLLSSSPGTQTDYTLMPVQITCKAGEPLTIKTILQTGGGSITYSVQGTYQEIQ